MKNLQPEVRDWEPRIALTPEGDGLDAYRKIALAAKSYLNTNGHIILEIGYDQAESVQKIFKKAGYADGYCWQDLAGKDRIVGFSLP
jgi:release factor glutamine methyltransferase